MTNFSYTARDRAGALTKGIMDAENSKAVALQLSKLGYTPVSIVESGSGKNTAKSARSFFASFGSKISNEDLIVFSRQLASILEAGVPLMEGLEAVHEQIKNVKFKEVVLSIKKDIEGGTSFSEAIEKHEKIFSSMVVNMVRAGERAGILDEVLDRVSGLLEKDLETKDKIKSATRYPIIVMATLAIAFGILTVFVIPRFATFFEAFDAELPLPTRILIGMNDIIMNYWYWVLGLMAVSIYTFRRFVETERGRYLYDRLMLSAPVFGPLFLRIHLSRFSRMLAAMIKSGVAILEALLISSATAENKVISNVILDVRNDVSQGRSLAEPMKASNIFPPIAVSMVSIGEKAGTLESMLNKVADYFDREADYTIKNLTPLLEPILLAGLGGVMLLFALGIFLPMWDLVRVYQSF